MSNTFSISIVGAGNLAWNLAPTLENAGHIIKEISSLHIESAQSLAKSLYNTDAKDHTNFLNSDIDILILAVRDDILEDLASEIEIDPKTIVVHCSGNSHIEKLNSYSGPTGVFYPLQTFSKGYLADFTNIPICIESFDENAEEALIQLGKSISKKVSFVSSEDRRVMHLSAVFANNFVNHLLSQSQDILKDVDIDFSVLSELVKETMRKSFELGPKQSQTGPAKRGDIQTIRDHLKILEKHSNIAEVYELISQQLLDSNDQSNR